MTRDQEISLLNFVTNQPEVLPFLAPGHDEVEMSRFFKNPKNVMLGDDRGVVLFGHCGNNIYEMHYLFTHALRGRKALLACRTALKTMFTVYGAEKIVGQTPRDNEAARFMNRALGGVQAGTSVDSQGRACVNYVLERASWATSLAT
jgi:hypothetical protein